MRIGILADKFVDWHGGVDFLLLLIESLRGQPVEVFVFIPTKKINIISIAKDLIKRRQSKSTIINYLIDELSNNEKYYFYSNDSELQSLLKKHKVSILLPVFDPTKKFAVPSIGYIYDLQHKYKPDWFSSEDIENRDRHFQLALDAHENIIVNSEAVIIDVCKFYGSQYEKKLYALPFSTRAAKYQAAPSKTEGNYFVVANQFWRHKDHLCAIKAFIDMEQQLPNESINLILTGKIEDYRGHSHIKEIQKLIVDKPSISTPGFIDSADLSDLVRNAKLLIQPTLFEGGRGGGAVGVALSNGTPCVISDIPVNLELKGTYGVSFFRAHDHEDLSRILLQTYKENYNRKKIQEHSRQSVSNLGEYLVNLCKAVISNDIS